MKLKLYFTLFILFVLVLIAFVFGSQNDQLITINYMIARAEIPVAMAVSIFTLIGFLLGLFTVLLYKILKPFKRKTNTQA